MKKFLILTVLILIMAMGISFSSTQAADVIISTTIGETTTNSGIRVVETYEGGTDATAFDAAFFSAGSVVTLASGKDTSVASASGGFVVMVRRPTGTSVKVTVSGTAMTSGTSTIPYKISGTESPTAVVYVDYTSSGSTVATSYRAATAVDGILRDAKAFTYDIPVSADAPLGTYSATITFSITVE